MINELNDEEIINFLMTSEFEENYKPEEFRYLLSKFRYFYRLLHGKNELNQNNSEFQIKKLTEITNDKDSQITLLNLKNSDQQNLIDSLKNRKLTLKERVTGKIITNDEN